MCRCGYVLSIAATIATTIAVAAGEGGSQPPPPPPSERKAPSAPLPESGRRFRNGPGIWQVFSSMEPEERKRMQKLQREDPAKFREIMQAKAEELYRKRLARRAELEALARQCRKTQDEALRAELRKKLVAEVEKDFRKHLQANRRHLADLKHRAASMEKELNRREANCAKAVEARVDAMIRGEKPPRPPESRRLKLEKLEK